MVQRSAIAIQGPVTKPKFTSAWNEQRSLERSGHHTKLKSHGSTRVPTAKCRNSLLYPDITAVIRLPA